MIPNTDLSVMLISLIVIFQDAAAKYSFDHGGAQPSLRLDLRVPKQVGKSSVDITTGIMGTDPRGDEWTSVELESITPALSISFYENLCFMSIDVSCTQKMNVLRAYRPKCNNE